MPPQEREEPDLLTPGAWERQAQLLRNGQVEVVGRLPYSTNRTFLVRCCDDHGEIAAVYKPAAGERPLSDFPDGTLYRREVAAYVVDSALGWGFVPFTIARDDLPFGVGSLQLFIDHDPEQHYFTLLDEHRDTFQRLAFFDILCNSADRKSGHCLLDPTGHVWAVDNGLTFHVEPKLRTVIWDFAGEPLPEKDQRDVTVFATEFSRPDSPLRAELGRWLTDDELAMLERRAAVLQQPGEFPHPDSSWSFPWPLV